MISVKIEGAAELERKLAQLESKVSRKIVRTAVKKAQKFLIPVIKSYLAAIGKGGGMSQKIAKALKVKAGKRRRGSYTMNVLMKGEGLIYYTKGSALELAESKTKKGKIYHKQISGRRYYIPAAIEYGHGRNKEQAARPYMRPAADMTTKERLNILIREINRGLVEVWCKK